MRLPQVITMHRAPIPETKIPTITTGEAGTSQQISSVRRNCCLLGGRFKTHEVSKDAVHLFGSSCDGTPALRGAHFPIRIGGCCLCTPTLIMDHPILKVYFTLPKSACLEKTNMVPYSVGTPRKKKTAKAVESHRRPKTFFDTNCWGL